MARSVKLMLVVIVLTVGIVGAIWLWSSPSGKPSEEQVSDGNAAVSPQAPVTQQESAVSPVTTAQPKPMRAEPISQDPEPPVEAEPEPIAKAMESMSNSLSAGDPRTPELAAPYERVKPSAEVLADPERYAEYEESQSRTIASAYLSMLNQIPTLRARIDAAKASGSQTPEEIAEAEEALAKLEELKREMEATHPEMLQPAAEPPNDSVDVSSPE